MLDSIKSASKMDQMRADMGGAANVVSAILALAQLKVKVNIKGMAIFFKFSNKYAQRFLFIDRLHPPLREHARYKKMYKFRMMKTLNKFFSQETRQQSPVMSLLDEVEKAFVLTTPMQKVD